MLGEHAVGAKRSASCRADPRPRPPALRGRDPAASPDRRHGTVGLAVGHVEADDETLAALHASRFHQTANADARAWLDMLLEHVGWRVEEHDRILERVEHQRNSQRQHTQAAPIKPGVVACGSSRHPRTLSLRDPALSRDRRSAAAWPLSPGERPPRIADRGERLVALAEHHIGANEPQPALNIGTLAMEPRR